MIGKNFSKKALRLPYSILVPIASVIVWDILILIPVLILFVGLHSSPSGSQSHAFWWSFQMIASLRAPLVNGINLPGFILNSLASLLLFGSARWYPAAMAPEILRVITTLILCLPAWWFVGRGVEAILGSRKVRWQTLVSGALLCAIFFASAIGLRFGMSPQERAEMTVPIWSFFFWAATFAIPTIAWCVQKVRRSETALTKA